MGTDNAPVNLVMHRISVQLLFGGRVLYTHQTGIVWEFGRAVDRTALVSNTYCTQNAGRIQWHSAQQVS